MRNENSRNAIAGAAGSDPASDARTSSATEDDGPIALLLDTIPGLADSALIDEILALQRLGQRVHIYALAPSPEAAPGAKLARAPIRMLPAATLGGVCDYCLAHAALFATTPIRYLDAFRKSMKRAGGLAAFLRAGWLAHRLGKAGIRHIHAHSPSAAADIAEAGSDLGQSYSMSVRSGDVAGACPADLRRKLQRARFTVACSDHTRRLLTGLAPGAAIHRIYRGVDLDRFHPRLRESPTRPPLLLAVGTLRHEKGFDTLIHACRLLRDQRVRFRCDIVGCGPEHEALERRIDAAGLFGLVVLTGRLSRSALVARYAEASLLVQPSRVGRDGRSDGIPRVLTEAMAMHLPVVATAVGGIPELVRNGETGILVPAEDAAALAHAARRVIEDAALRRRLAEAARTLVARDFGAEHSIGRLREILAESRARSRHQALLPPAFDRRKSLHSLITPAP